MRRPPPPVVDLMRRGAKVCVRMWVLVTFTSQDLAQRARGERGWLSNVAPVCLD